MVESIYVSRDKSMVYITCYNFLGFLKPKHQEFKIDKLIFLGEEENNNFWIGEFGLPTFLKLLWWDKPNSMSKFYKFAVNNNIFLIPKDIDY